MSMVYHSYDSNHSAVNALVAGAYAEHTGTLGFDEDLSSISRNAVENRVITARILEDEGKYLLKTDASTTYVAKSNFATELNTAIQTYYPVGTIYMNDRSSSVPFDFGTWQLINAKFLYGCNSSFSDLRTTGGATSVTLSTSHFPTGNIGITFPAVSGTTGYTDTNHFHYTNSYSGYTGNVTGTEDGEEWSHYHSPRSPTASSRITTGYTADDDSSGGNFVFSIGNGGTKYAPRGRFGNLISSANLQHSHPFTVPSLVTGGMDRTTSHAHDFSIPAQSLNFKINSGTQNSFSIVPPYYKVAIWHRTA